jgi:hypothetical protein
VVSSQAPLFSIEQVQQLLQQLCTMLHRAAAQTLSNVAWALTVLQQCHCERFVIHYIQLAGGTCCRWSAYHMYVLLLFSNVHVLFAQVCILGKASCA